MKSSALLSSDALDGRTIGLSVSDSADLGRLGLLETHLRLVLGEVTRAVLLAGGSIAYGGRIDPAGYTAFLRHEVEKYGRTDAPLLSCLAWSEHRSRTLSELEDAREDLGLYGTVVCLGPDGEEVDPRADRDDAPAHFNDEDVVRGLTSLRRYLTERTDARVLVGGRRVGFKGELPGVLEEAVLSIESGQPLYIAGGFGGISGDLACALGVVDAEWLRSAEADTDERAVNKLEELRAEGVDLPGNGLDEDENKRLATAYRPSEIATLVAVGLARLNDGRAVGDTA